MFRGREGGGGVVHVSGGCAVVPRVLGASEGGQQGWCPTLGLCPQALCPSPTLV